MTKEPKRWECTECGFKSNRCKTVKPSSWVTFAVCVKCGGQIKDNKEWVQWIDDMRKRTIKQAQEHNGGMLLGVDVSKVKVD